jgi:hypothetical protein
VDSVTSFLHDLLKPLVVIAIIIILILTVSGDLLGLLLSIRLVGTGGRISASPNIAIYEDVYCTISLSYIDWGSLEPGLTRNVTMYIRNEGTGGTTLSLSTANWQPANISSYMNLTWTYGGRGLLPHDVVEVTLTLWSSYSPSFAEYLIAYDVRDFSFDVVINAMS